MMMEGGRGGGIELGSLYGVPHLVLLNFRSSSQSCLDLTLLAILQPVTKVFCKSKGKKERVTESKKSKRKRKRAKSVKKRKASEKINERVKEGKK